MATYTDADDARALLEKAIAMDVKPTIAEADVDLLMRLAAVASTDDDDNPITVYTSDSLNRVAATGWVWKAGLTSPEYNLGGGPGKTLTRDQWFQHCQAMQAAFASGTASVDGDNVITSTDRQHSRSIGVVGLVSSGRIVCDD